MNPKDAPEVASVPRTFEVGDEVMVLKSQYPMFHPGIKGRVTLVDYYKGVIVTIEHEPGVFVHNVQFGPMQLGRITRLPSYKG